MTTPAGPLAIWNALLSAGASSVQAAGIMGNFIAESSLNPETDAMDTNGYRVYGLASWNAASYPQASSLVTGNPAQDIVSQIQFLTQTGGLQAASGSTVSDTAGNFAANYERCNGCQPGGSQWTQRIANAEQVAGWASSGNWPSSLGQAATSATLTSAELASESQGTSDCLWEIGWGQGSSPSWWEYLISPGAVAAADTLSGQVCLLSKSQARWISGATIVGFGATILALGAVLMMVSSGFTPASLLLRAASPAATIASGLGIRGTSAARQPQSASPRTAQQT